MKLIKKEKNKNGKKEIKKNGRESVFFILYTSSVLICYINRQQFHNLLTKLFHRPRTITCNYITINYNIFSHIFNICFFKNLSQLIIFIPTCSFFIFKTPALAKIRGEIQIAPYGLPDFCQACNKL